MLTLSISEFIEKWDLEYETELYSNGNMKGEIVYEDEKYIVLKII